MRFVKLTECPLTPYIKLAIVTQSSREKPSSDLADVLDPVDKLWG
jgi:hypothetical protein